MSRSGRGLRRLTLAAAVGLAWGRPAAAQLPLEAPRQPEKAETGEERAHQHFSLALELYRAGRYALALTELKRAAALDPNGKDLFFNLALVQEKLGELDQAIAALERFRELETDPTERERADVSIDRLRGAQATLKQPPRTEPCAEPPALPAAPAPRVNPVVIGAVSVAGVAFVVGTIFGIKALSDDVGGERTSSALSITQLRERGDRAERAALVADVAFAVSAAAGGLAFGVWLLEPRVDLRGSARITLRSEF